jgi:hypothetical protein
MTQQRKRKSRPKHRNGPPKGAYRLPTGGYVTESVGPLNKRGRRVRIVAVHRDEPDPRKVANALIAIVLEQRRAQTDERCHSDV